MIYEESNGKKWEMANNFNFIKEFSRDTEIVDSDGIVTKAEWGVPFTAKGGRTFVAFLGEVHNITK